jgi:hypothetical protein
LGEGKIGRTEEEGEKWCVVQVNARASWGAAMLRPYMIVTMDRAKKIL